MIIEMKMKLPKGGVSVLYLVAIYLCSCTNTPSPDVICQEEGTGKVVFKKVKELNISIDSFPQKYYHPRVCFDNQQQEYLLVTYNSFAHSISRYNLDTREESPDIPLKKEGPNAISPEFEDFYYINQDSIIFLDGFGSEQLKYWIKGTVRPLFTNTSDLFALAADPENNFRLTYQTETQKLFGYTYPVTVYDDKKAFFDQAFIFQLDLVTNELLRYGKFPYPHLDQALGFDYIPTSIYLGDSTLLSFGGVDFIQVVTPEWETERRYCAKSRDHQLNLKGFKSDFDHQRFRNFFNERAWYLDFHYDPFRKVFYRIIKHRQPIRNSEGKLNSLFDAGWSVIVFSEKLEKLGEYSFNGGVYNPFDFFITPKGIYLGNRLRETESSTAWDLYQLAYEN